LLGVDLDLLGPGGERVALLLVVPQRSQPRRVDPGAGPVLDREEGDLRAEVEVEEVRLAAAHRLRPRDAHAPFADIAEAAARDTVDQRLARGERKARRGLRADRRRGGRGEKRQRGGERERRGCCAGDEVYG